MITGASIFLFLLPLAAAPVVFHLLMRRQRKTVIFSTKLFFNRMKPQLTFYRKFREQLLLAARVLMIAFLLLALARLMLPGMADVLGLSGNQAVVVVIDNSGSMVGQVEGGDRTKLKVAIEGARALLSNMDDKGKASVVLLVPDPKAGRLSEMTSDKQQLLDYLEQVEVTEASGNPTRSTQRAMALLKEAAPAGGGSVHIFTDLQETEWNKPAVETGDEEGSAAVFFHRVPTAAAELPNVCVMSAKASSRRILPNQPYQVEVLLRNDGDEEVEIRVNRKSSEQPIADVKTVTVGGGEQKTVKLGFQPKFPGRHWIQIWIEGDGFEGDNKAFVAYICEPKADIYFVGEKESAEFGLLPLAFSPRGDGRISSLVPSFMTLESLADRLQKKQPTLVVLKWSDALALKKEASDLLEQYTRQGGNLLVLPAVAGKKPSGEPPAWLGAAPEVMKVFKEAAPLLVSDNRSEFWSDLRGVDGTVRIGKAHVSKYYPLSFSEDAGYVPLLASGDEGALLAIRSLGKGQITVSGIAFDGGGEGEWSTLPRKKAFLVMAQPMALGAVSSLVNENMSLVAGNAPRSLPGKGEEVKITTLLGDQVDWTGPRDQVPTLVRGGAYIVSEGKQKTCLSVVPSDVEGDGAFIHGSEVAAMGAIAHEVHPLSNEETFRDELELSVAGVGLYLPLLLLAFAVLAAEALLGSPSPKMKRKVAAEYGQEKIA